MRKLKLFKSLLVVATLLVGGNAWAEVVETTVVDCDFENGETLFSATKDPGNATRVTVSNAGEESAHYVNFANGNNASNGNAIATYNFSALTSDASAVDIEFDAYLSSGSPNYHHIFTIGDASTRAHTKQNVNNTGAIFTFGMRRGKWNGAGSNVNYWSINNEYTTNSEANFGKWLHVNVYVDLVNKKVTYSIKNQAQTETINSGEEIAFLDGAASACTQIDYNSCLNDGSARVDNLVIKKYKDNSAVATTYTVKYQDTNGSTLKSDAIYDIYAGNVYSASASDMATFYSNDNSKKYVYKSGQNTETVASETASENVITLVFNTYNKYDYTIKQKLGDNDATEVSNGSKYSDETLTYYYAKCVQSGDDYYVINANGSEPLYGVTVSSSNTSPTIIYALDEDIVYYAECETLYGGTFSANYFTEKSSNGVSKAMNDNVFMKTSMSLAADGVYDVTISGGNRDTGHTTTANLKLIDSSDEISEGNILSQYMSGGAWIGEMNASKVTIPAGSELYLATDNTGGVSRYVFDYIIVRKSKASKTITAAGWATYCSDKALDFSNPIANLTKAYLITGSSSSSLTLEPITGTIPANTGILLEGNGEVAIPVAASSDTDVSANKLVGVTEETAGVAAGIYVLMNGDNGVGFYHTVNAFTVGANTAYLPANFAGTSARAFFGFDDEATGISNNNRERIVNNGYYNLNGQRVAQPTKGLYIVDGKKVVIKK